MPIEGHWVVVGASIGIARFPADGDDPGTLLRKADAAMYRAKASRSRGVEFATRAGFDRAPEPVPGGV